MTPQRGTVLYAADPFRSGSGRPYVVLSGEEHPFADEECLAEGIDLAEKDIDAIAEQTNQRAMDDLAK